MHASRTLLSIATGFAVLAATASLVDATPNPHADIECTFCHLDVPRFGVDTRETVTFWRAEGDEPALCERCHGAETNFHPLGVEPGAGRLGTHSPVNLPLGETEAVRGQVVCTTCHFVHAANAESALLRGFPGSDNPGTFSSWQELCRECHGAGLEKRSPHTGDERSCAFCHSSKPQAGQPVSVTPQGRKLCEFCHGGKSDDHFAGVNPYPERRDCTGCHDPHLGKDHPARLRQGYLDPIRAEVTLNPHRKRSFCFACHGDGKPKPLRQDEAVAICQRCHGSGKIPGMSHPMTKVPAGYTIPEGWPLVDGALTCATCHFPGHAPGTVAGRPDEPADPVHLLRGVVPGERNAVCFRCHAKSQWARLSPHQDAARGNKKACVICHAVDPEEGDTDVFVADINIVCLSCHDDPDHPAGARHTVTLKAGMPEVRGSLPLGTGRRITCATCHDPHLESPAEHRLRGAGARGPFCSRCHSL
jgi:hypothetical protein